MSATKQDAKRNAVPAAVRDAGLAGSGRLVLIVEDNPANLLLADAALRRGGFLTMAAPSAEAALSQLQLQRPDVILMDVQLPGMDGLALTRQLKADPFTTQIPVVALTAYAMPDDQMRAVAAGCDGYLTKPINPVTLAAQVDDVLATCRRGRASEASERGVLGDEGHGRGATGTGMTTNGAESEPGTTRTPGIPGTASIPGTAGRILVIDDNAPNVAFIQAQLTRAGYEVSKAATGRAGLDAALAQRPDLVLLDVMMPGLNGYEVCRRLKENPATQPIPVVMLTALRDQEDKIAGLDAGADDFLSKPVEPAELLARARALLRTKRLHDTLLASKEEIQQQAAALAAERGRMEAVLYSLSDGVMAVDKDGRITLVNPAAEAISGVTVEEGLGREWHTMLALRGPGTASTVESGDVLTQLLANRQSASPQPLVLRRPDGRELTISLNVAPLDRASGEANGVVSVFRDITEQTGIERRQAAQHAVSHILATATELHPTLSQLLEAICRSLDWDYGALWELDRQRGAMRCITDWVADGLEPPEPANRQWIAPGVGLPSRVRESRQTTWLADVLPDRRFQAQEPPLVADPHVGIGVPVQAGGEVLAVLELLAQHRDEPDRALAQLLESIGSQIGQFMQRVRVEEALRAANEALERRVAERTGELQRSNRRLRKELAGRKRAEAEVLEINKRLRETVAELETTQQQVVQQERLRALGEMASGIAHDFNNALAPIVGFSELLLVRPEEIRDPEKVRSYLELINMGASDAARVVARLREFYRTKEEEDLAAPLALDAVTTQAVSLSQPKWKDLAQVQGCTIEVSVDCEPAPTMLGDGAALREALMNLIFNAVDAILASTAEQEVRAGQITLRSGYDARTRQVRVTVSDSGGGMSEDVRRRCLDPFFSTKGEHGTGLGLSMVHGIVQRHGGFLDIESVVGEGTSITLRFPAHEEHSEAGEPAPALALARVQSLRVLVVDDDPHARSAAEHLLAADGHSVTTATSGQEALELLEELDQELIVTDRAMPGMSGDQLAEELRRRGFGGPIILLTGFGDLMIEAGERPAGIDRVVGKPATLTGLRRALSELAGRSEPAALAPLAQT